MKEVFVSKLGIKIPAIGFGCSALTGTDRNTALRVLETAFDRGVRHFDVARYYGYGEAEGILGAFIRSRRSTLTLTTKFGIQAPRKSSALGVALRAGRRLVRLLPAARGLAQRKAQALVKTGAFSVEEARTSLETSLRALGTDHVDIYLLHDYAVGEQSPDELIAFLESAVSAGKIRCFGIGTSIESVLQALEHAPRLCNVIQFQNSLLTRNIEKLPGIDSNRLVITHGALSDSYRRVLSFFNSRRELAKQWADKLGVSEFDENTLAELMLNYAADANRDGLVLFSSRDPARVSKNVDALAISRFPPAQIAAFAEFVAAESHAFATPGDA
jgi:D-threo-aldose 1-dehydrogenase